MSDTERVAIIFGARAQRVSFAAAEDRSAKYSSGTLRGVLCFIRRAAWVKASAVSLSRLGVEDDRM